MGASFVEALADFRAALFGSLEKLLATLDGGRQVSLLLVQLAEDAGQLVELPASFRQGGFVAAQAGRQLGVVVGALGKVRFQPFQARPQARPASQQDLLEQVLVFPFLLLIASGGAWPGA